MKPKILARWDNLSPDEVERTGGDFYAVVELIRNRYKPGRSHITVEASILDWFMRELDVLDGADRAKLEPLVTPPPTTERPWHCATGKKHQ